VSNDVMQIHPKLFLKLKELAGRNGVDGRRGDRRGDRDWREDQPHASIIDILM
jgi:hypothetical protein